MKNLIYILILALIGIPSWQIGSILMEKKQASYLLKEQANSIKRYKRIEVVKNNLKSTLELKGMPTDFTIQKIDTEFPGKPQIKITYPYSGDATIFGYTYYQTSITMESVTEYK